MPRRKADTTFTQLIKVLEQTESDPQMLTNLIKAIEKTIPVRRRKNMPKVDTNLNKRFRIQRINYEITADIIEFHHDINSYCMKVLTVTGQSKVCPGVFLFISKRELELQGRIIA